MPNQLENQIGSIPQTSAAPMPSSSPQPQTPSSPQPTSLDPDAVNLTKAIRQTESGNNPTQEGASGEYGAYQWLPATWAKMSAAAGVNVPLKQSTPEQQNQVAYTQVKAWKDAGYNVGQIASMWNAGEGDPNAYIQGNQGVNSSGVPYNTAAYAKRVATAYQQLKSLGPAQGQSQGQPNAPINPSDPASPTALPAGTPNTTGTFGKELAGAANAALPITGDIGGDINGTNSKTPLQQGGDALQSALTAALLIPGAQPEDLAAKAGLTGIGGRIGANAAAGGLIGASNAVGQGGGAGQIATQGLLGGLLGGGASAGLEGLGALQSKVGTQNNIQSIVDKLMPNFRSTGPEVRAAMNDGRIIDGTKSTFWGSTPDTVAPKAKTIINAQTLESGIPGIADMSPQNMVRAIDDTTSGSLEKLEPVMNQTPVTQADTGKIFDAWDKLQQSQQDDIHFGDAPSTAKMQPQFERYLKQLSWDTTDPATGLFKAPTPKNLGHVVGALRDYDAAVSDDIKNLGPNPDRTDLLQHKTWLQNRTLLSSARDDLASRLAPDVQKTFKTVSNMLDARRALVANARISTKATPGLLQKATGFTGRQVTSGLGLIAGGGTVAGLIDKLFPQQNANQ